MDYIPNMMTRIARNLKRIPPWLTLLLLAPVLGELVSGHQSPLEFINPLNFVILSLPYGFGALICRELVVRWKKGWLSLLVLGMAYGIYEEAIVVHSIFNPQWSELGALANYGYFGGVNWTWGELMIHFHALISIGASVGLVQLMYPERQHQRWLGNKGLIACFVGILLWVPVMAVIMMLSKEWAAPPLGWYLLSWFAVFVLGYVAYRLPAQSLHFVGRIPARPVWFFFLGLINMFAFFFTVFLTADYSTPPLVVTALMLLVIDGVTLWLALRWSGNGYGWDGRHYFALFAGFLAFFIFFSIDKDFEKWQGSAIIGLIAIIALWYLGRFVARHVRLQKEGRQSIRADSS